MPEGTWFQNLSPKMARIILREMERLNRTGGMGLIYETGPPQGGEDGEVGIYVSDLRKYNY